MAAGVGDRRAARGAVELGQGRRLAPPASRSCSARSPRSRCSASRFFGKNAVSFLMVLPIALPGIVTAVALQNTLQPHDRPRPRSTSGSASGSTRSSSPTPRSASSSPTTTSIARLRRSSPNLLEASADLGAHGSADVPLHHVPAGALGAARRRHPGVRAQLRRDRRHHVHRPAPASRRCRSGSSTTSAGRATSRWSTSMATFVMVRVDPAGVARAAALRRRPSR